MTAEGQSKASLSAIVVTVISIAVWTFYVLLIMVFPDPFANDSLRAIARVLLVLAPAIIHIYRQQDGPLLDYLELRRNFIGGSLLGLATAGTYLVLALGMNMNRPTLILPQEGAVWFNFIIGSPVAEEFLFRGVLFNELCRITKWYWAMIFSAVLFVCLHLPVWILLDGMSVSLLIQSALNIFVYGLVFAALLKITRSLWAPIAAHCLNNFILLSVIEGV